MSDSQTQDRAEQSRCAVESLFGEVCLYATRRSIHHFMLDGKSDLLCRRAKPDYLELIDVMSLAEAKAVADEPANARHLCTRCEAKMRDLFSPNNGDLPCVRASTPVGAPPINP